MLQLYAQVSIGYQVDYRQTVSDGKSEVEEAGREKEPPGITVSKYFRRILGSII